MNAPMTCPVCGSSALFHSRRQRKDGLRRLLFLSAYRCRACGHRHFRVNLIAVATTAAIALVAAALLGAGDIAWTRHAHQGSVSYPSAPATPGDA